jgi:DNA-directed RNA polymerase alpha subunit
MSLKRTRYSTLADVGIDELGIGAGREALRRANIESVGQLDSLTNAELLAIEGIGPLKLEHIRQCVDDMRSEFHATGAPEWWDKNA